MVCIWFDLFWTQKNTLSLLIIFSKSLWLTVLKDLHASHKNLKFNFFWAYLVCITKVDMWVNLVFRGWNYKLFSNNEKAAKTERNLWNNIFDYALINQASKHSLHFSLINFHCLSFNFPLFLFYWCLYIFIKQ